MHKNIKNSQTLTCAEYKQLVQANLSILSQYPIGSAYCDYTRASLATEAFKLCTKGKVVPKRLLNAYFTKALLPHSISDISEAHFKKLHSLYGDSIARLRIIDENLFRYTHTMSKNTNVLNTGGACALESVDTKILNTFQNKKREDLIIPYLQSYALTVPTWSQVTGAIVAKNGLNIMYDETYPWYLRFEKYGIKNAQVFVRKIYDEIYTTSARFVKIQNPESMLIRVPFTELNLEEDGSLKAMYTLYKDNLAILQGVNGTQSVCEYNNQLNNKMWVEYTYQGNEILKKLKDVIHEKYPHVYEEYQVQKSEIHVRAKQIDHLTTERQDVWINEIILNGTDAIDKKNKRKIQHFMKMHNKVHVLGLSMWFKDNFRTVPVGFGGMLDFSFKGELVHEHNRREILERMFKNAESVHMVTDLVFRPSAVNIEKVLVFLEKHTEISKYTVSKEALLKIDAYVQDEKKLLRKIENLRVFLIDFELFNRVWSRYKDAVKGKEIHKLTVTISTLFFKKVRGRELFTSLIQRYKQDYSLFPTAKNEKKDAIWREQSELKLHSFISTIRISRILQNKVEFVIHANAQQVVFGDRLCELISQRSAMDKDHLDTLEQKLVLVRNSISTFMEMIEIDILQMKQLSNQESVHILPLADNYLISFMQQFLFISKVRSAYIKLARIEIEKTSKRIKEEKIISISRKVFPILKKNAHVCV